jgi:hypothetical protein
MALKGKKLHPDDIQGIRGFAMVYKGLAIFAIAYKELAQKCITNSQKITVLLGLTFAFGG